MALMEAESGLCGDCGHPLAETTAANAEGAYDASLSKCHACIAGALRTAQFQDEGGKTQGLKVAVFRRET